MPPAFLTSPVPSRRIQSRAQGPWFLTSGLSCRLLFDRVEAARRDIHVSVRKFLGIRSDDHVRIG
jgi:hypothetical protein